MEIVISIVAKLAEYTVAPIVRQLSYPFLYNRNINNLRVRRQHLVDARKDVQNRVDEDKNNGRETGPEVSRWLETVDNAISEDQQNESPSCFNLLQRYQRSREAKKKEKEFSELIQTKHNFNNRVGHLVPLSGIESSDNIPENYQFLDSRTLMAREIKDALASSDFNRIGLFGMGGVGKTTLLHEVQELVLGDKLFDQVIKVTIGQTVSVEDIQAQMGDKLRLELNKAESKQGRADLLRNKLEVGNKLLVIFDDLWDKLDLVAVGIPCTSKLSEKGSKILITSRQRNVLMKKMDVQKCFQLNHLSEEESWKFFSAIVGEFDRVDIRQVAENVAKECGGLPLALILVAKSLKGEELGIWKDALNRLKNPIAEKIEGVTDILYSSIKMSYDRIKSTEARLLFLLCSVFPDDYEISVKKLQMYAMGMRLLNGVNTWDEARNRVIKLVNDLISSSLLLKSKDKYVKMHDVVRDIAIHIASSKEDNMSALNFGYKDSEWPEEDRRGSFRAIFGDLQNFQDLPQNLQFPNLELLILSGWYQDGQLRLISNTFFEGMEKLRVLDLSRIYFQELRISLTHTLVENLRIFCMEECGVNDIDIIGELKMLQILRIKECWMIGHLPSTMSKLAKLKVLGVSNCRNLKVIPANIISSMTKLEELDLSFSFGRWGELDLSFSFKGWGKEVLYENELVKNVRLSELENLPHLISLKLHMLDERMLQDLLFLQNLKLENFQFIVGPISFYPFKLSRSLILQIKSEVDLIDRVFGTLWQRCEHLEIEALDGVGNLRFKSNENGHPSLSQENTQNDISFFDDKAAFPDLKYLSMSGSGNNLKMVWHHHGLIANSFCKLETICISEFKGLGYILSSNVVKAFVSLKSLSIESCELVETIFEMEEQNDDAKIMPLMELYLYDLPKLKCVWNKDPSGFLIFPNIQEVKVRECPELQSVFPASFINHVQKLQILIINSTMMLHQSSTGGGVALQLFSEDKTLVFPEEIIVFPELRMFVVECMTTESLLNFRSAWFPRLQTLNLNYVNGDIKYFQPEMNKTLHNIEELEVSGASKLVQLFSDEEESNDSDERSCANLKELRLGDLPELTHLWKDKSRLIKFDNLESLVVKECGKLKCLVPPSISMLKLRYVEVSGCHKLKNLVSSSMATSVVEITVHDSREMSCIFGGDEEEHDEIVFSKLKRLEIRRLERVESFYSAGKCNKLVFPALEKLIVDECPTILNTFSRGTTIISTPQLKRLRINGTKVLYSPTKHHINDIFYDYWWYDVIWSIRYLFTQLQDEEEDLEDFSEDER